jgi:glyoxylase-like metal-dependent hydrolase (beta-lactamase superfamily II)
MESIKKYISTHSQKKDIIVFNSHSDWDHIWGNCAFKGKMIIGHETCRKRMMEIGPFELATLSEYHCGSIDLVLPNLTFSKNITFAEEEVEFIYAPGHTVDSTVCFDKRDSVLFVGDLVEYPIPYLDFYNLETYIKTLDFIKRFPAKVKLAAHSGIIDNGLIDRNTAYIQNILEGKPVDPSIYQECQQVHNFNINNRLFLKYENMVREKLKESFNYTSFRTNFGDLKEVGYADLQESLEHYWRVLEK